MRSAKKHREEPGQEGRLKKQRMTRGMIGAMQHVQPVGVAGRFHRERRRLPVTGLVFVGLQGPRARLESRKSFATTSIYEVSLSRGALH